MIHPGEKFSQWWLGVGLGGLLACGLGLAIIAGAPMDYGALPLVFFIGVFGGVSFSQGAFAAAWMTEHGLEMAERRAKLPAPAAVVEAPPEPDPEDSLTPDQRQEMARVEAWRYALQVLVEWGRQTGGLTATLLVGGVVKRNDDWVILTDALVDVGLAYKERSGTKLKARTWDAALAALKFHDLEELPDGWPPHVTPPLPASETVVDGAVVGER